VSSPAAPSARAGKLFDNASFNGSAPSRIQVISMIIMLITRSDYHDYRDYRALKSDKIFVINMLLRKSH